MSIGSGSNLRSGSSGSVPGYMVYDNNLLARWPTYTIDFTPEHLGPLKLVLRLKDASSYRSTEDDDSADEAEGMAKVKCTPLAIEEDPGVTMACEATSKDGTWHVSANPV
ncbi:hypothetical protein DFJ58DRAFT_733585 [Suillus subalutaceus]|uniref:uncharacterized protein n=1 Tax=Suillus subalutaceus TaxID=48586 RepID=UPI001B869F07|nr:uncharacterized protein DFJ58DRAFT_733585 [Suillus subalutaceus]KAG1838851.1 hypothetical protein DFJ58DRAFT_733585 [Suillus subalutaceus]